MTPDEQTHAAKIALRAQLLVTACLAVVVLVMAVALTVVINVASNAQAVADRAVLVAQDLQAELACRYAINASADTAQAHLISLVSFSVVLRARENAEAELATLIENIDAAVTGLEVASIAASTAVEDCARKTPSEAS